MDAEVAEAIQEIVNETFNIDQATLAFRLHFSEDTQISAGTQKKINEALEYVYHDLFDFDGTGKELFKLLFNDELLFISELLFSDELLFIPPPLIVVVFDWKLGKIDSMVDYQIYY